MLILILPSFFNFSFFHSHIIQIEIFSIFGIEHLLEVIIHIPGTKYIGGI